MMRFWIAGVALAASVGAAQAQLDLSGAVPPTRPGATAGATPVEPVAPAKAPAEARKPDKADKSRSISPSASPAAVGQPLKLNGRDGELTLWGRDRALKIAKLSLAGEVISDPTQKCRIDIVGEQPIEAKSLGRPDGLARYEAEIPVCTVHLRRGRGRGAGSRPERGLRVQGRRLSSEPGRPVGPGRGVAGRRSEGDRAPARAQPTTRRRACCKRSQARLKGKPEADDVERDETDLVARGQEICRDYDKESDHGFCASRMAQVRAAWLKARADKLTHDAAKCGRTRRRRSCAPLRSSLAARDATTGGPSHAQRIP